MKTKLVKLRDLGAEIGHVDVISRSRCVGYHNCQENQLIEESVLSIKEDKSGKQYVERETVYVCPVCEATFRKVEE